MTYLTGANLFQAIIFAVRIKEIIGVKQDETFNEIVNESHRFPQLTQTLDIIRHGHSVEEQDSHRVCYSKNLSSSTCNI